MDFTMLSSIFTILSLLVFLGIIYWAYDSQNKERFEALGRLPIENDSDNELTGN